MDLSKRYISLRDAYGLTITHKAVIYDRQNIVQWLLEKYGHTAVNVTDHVSSS